MKYKDYYLTNRAGSAMSLTNICGYWPGRADVMDIQDAIEDATDGEDLCKRLNNMDLLVKPWAVNRVTDSYIRISHDGPLGNVDYLVIVK